MTSQLRPPSAPRPLPTNQQTRVEIQLPPTPFNSKDFVEMTESITRETSGGPKEHQQRIENQQPQWQPLALRISSPKTPHPAPRYPQPRIRGTKIILQKEIWETASHLQPTDPAPWSSVSGASPTCNFPAPTESSISSKRTITAESPMTSYRTANTPPH
jgi:hypothetical protein